MGSVSATLLTIAAILVSPVIALELEKWLGSRRATRDRKLYIFKTLMTYRATPLSPLFVQALNLIDVEFGSAKEKLVRDAWKELLDHFYNYKAAADPQDKTRDLTAVLLAAMGKSLGYDFDKVYLKKAAYYPEGLGNVEIEQNTLRRNLLDLLDGKRKFPVAIFEQKFPPLADEQPTKVPDAQKK